MTTRCPAKEELRDFVLGRSSDETSHSIEAHLSSCQICLESLADLEASDSFVEVVRGGASHSTVVANVGAELINRLCSLRLALRSNEQETPLGQRALLEGFEHSLDLPISTDAAGELSRIGSFRLQKVLGHGGMGIVYKAEQLRPRRSVALKMIRRGPWASRERLDRFRGESEILARTRHPNIVQVFEVGEHDGQPFFTMEYAAGGSLANKLATAPLAPQEAADLLQTLSRAVHAAHGYGIVHRDLKPSNILVAADGTHLIGDFGLAKQLDGGVGGGTWQADATETGVILGTPSYMAPEQAGTPGTTIGPAADVYSLGAILYECLSGRPPFKAASVLETLEQLRSQEPVPVRSLYPGLPRDLETICLKCLQKDPRRRYTSAADLADDLKRFVDGKPILARPIRAWERTWKWAKRSPAAAGLFLVSCLAVVGVVLGILVHNSQLKSALDAARQNAEKAQRQQKLAQDHYEGARGTLDKMLEEFQGLRLDEVRQLRELQRRQLEDALAFYQKALNEQGDANPEVRNDVAIACKRVADLQCLLGRRTEAATNYTRAIQLLDSLPVELCETPSNQFLLATSYNNRGLVANHNRQWVDAERDHTTAHEIFETHWLKNPSDAQWRAGLAETEHFLGALHQARGNLPECEHFQLKAKTIYAKLVQDHPEVEGYRSKLVDCEINLALLYQSTNRSVEATRVYEQAEEDLRKLLAIRPSSAEYLNSLVALCSNWGLLIGGLGDRLAAIAKLDKAVEAAEKVLQSEPNYYAARQYALNAHGARAQMCEGLDRWADAVKDWDRVLALDGDPNPWLNRTLRAVALVNAGDYLRATTEGEVLSKNTGISADGLYVLAGVFSVSINLVLKDQGLDSEEHTKLADRYAAKAVSILETLKNKQYFGADANKKKLKEDRDLQPLRDRGDFKKLIFDVFPKK